jgi:type III secretion system FlhB-like substrate exporter
MGTVKLATLTGLRVHAFRDELVRDLSRTTAGKVLVALKSILKDARRHAQELEMSLIMVLSLEKHTLNICIPFLLYLMMMLSRQQRSHTDTSIFGFW